MWAGGLPEEEPDSDSGPLHERRVFSLCQSIPGLTSCAVEALGGERFGVWAGRRLFFGGWILLQVQGSRGFQLSGLRLLSLDFQADLA